jgi:hypothetical protein
VGKTTFQGGLEPRRAQRQGTVSQAVRHSAQGVLAERSDVGDDHDTHDDPGAENVEAGKAGNEGLE